MILRSLQYQHKKVSYTITGNGPAVVLIHGFAETGHIWQNTVSALHQHYTCIIPDLPGSGESESIGFEQEVTNIIDNFAIIIKEILVQESIAKCIMIGHSMGGYVSLSFAEQFPERITGLGLFHSTAYADSEEKKLNRLKSIQFIRNNGVNEFLKTSIPGLFKQPYHKLISEVFLQQTMQTSANTCIQYYEGMMSRKDRIQVLKALTVPVLFIIGEFDMAVPLSQSLSQCYLPAIAEIHILRNSAHMGMLEESLLSNQLISAFLANC